MKIEHVGLSVKEPHKMAEWYVKNLGFVIRRSAGNDQGGLAFISDPDQEAMLEIYNNNTTPPLDSFALPNLAIHIAFKSSDPDADLQRLIKAGATLIEHNDPKPGGDTLFLLKDPWGNVLQLAKRAKDF